MEKIEIGQPLVSIILPTYNVLPYLANCLDSIISQTYNNIEVIIIIDGATDGSFELAKKYCEQDSRFKLYWQENAGSGPARNNGLSKANGEFIVFIDPDDYIASNYIEQLIYYQSLNNADFITSGRITMLFSKNNKLLKRTISHNAYEIIDGEINIRKNYLRLLNNNLAGAPHCKLYKRNIILQNNISFPDLRRSQDIVFNLLYFSFIKSLCIIPYVGYNYRVSIKDRLKKLKPDYYQIVLYIHDLYIRTFTEWNINYSISELSSISYKRLEPWLESMVIQNLSLKEIINNIKIQKIIQQAKPSTNISKLTRHFILKKNLNALKLLLYFKHFTKQIIKR